jgi:hypothetical protein
MLIEEPLRPYLESHGISDRGMILISLSVVACILSIAIVASLVAGPSPKRDVE